MQGLEDKNIQVFKRLRKLATFANACMGGGGGKHEDCWGGKEGGSFQPHLSPQTRYLDSHDLTFLICKMGIVILHSLPLGDSELKLL